jgi:hypothetical protein
MYYGVIGATNQLKHYVPVPLALDVKVILTPPCVFH